jgi:hypothetical protein
MEGNFGPRLESRKTKDNKENSGETSNTVARDGSESDDALGKEFREAVEGGEL